MRFYKCTQSLEPIGHRVFHHIRDDQREELTREALTDSLEAPGHLGFPVA